LGVFLVGGVDEFTTYLPCQRPLRDYICMSVICWTKDFGADPQSFTSRKLKSNKT